MTINVGCRTDEFLPVLPGKANSSSTESTVAIGNEVMLHDEYDTVQKVLKF